MCKLWLPDGSLWATNCYAAKRCVGPVAVHAVTMYGGTVLACDPNAARHYSHRAAAQSAPVYSVRLAMTQSSTVCNPQQHKE